MADETLPDPFNSNSRELPTVEELERELAMHVPEVAAKPVAGDEQKLAFKSLRHLPYKERRALELRLGLTGKGSPRDVDEIAKLMGISTPDARKTIREAKALLGSYAGVLEDASAEIHKDKVPFLKQMAESLSQEEFEMLEMIAEGRTWAEAGRQLGIGGHSGAARLRRSLADRLGIDKKDIPEMEAIAPKLVRLAIESWREEKE